MSLKIDATELTTFSAKTPAPSLMQFQYSSFRKSLMYMCIIGIPFILFYMALYSYLYPLTSSWETSAWRLYAVACLVLMSFAFYSKTYSPHIPWLVILMGWCCYASLCQHLILTIPNAQSIPHMIAIGAIFIVGIMAISPLLSYWQIITSAIGAAAVPLIIPVINIQAEFIDFALASRLITSAVFVVLLGFKLKKDSHESYQTHSQLHQASQLDGLTGILNRIGFFSTVYAETERAKRESSSIGFAFIDIDLFKAVNDRFGHQAGDKVIKAVANSCLELIRPYDVIGRVGGEEFLIALPHIDVQSLQHIAERIRHQIHQLELTENQKPIKLTVSIGLSLLTSIEHSSDIETAIKEADKALYKAKELGRNRVELARFN